MDAVEERACDTCFTQEYLGAHPDYVMRVTRDSIEGQQCKDQFTKDPDGVPVCKSCLFTVSAHRREPPVVVTAPAGPPPVPIVSTYADIRKLTGIPKMPEAYAKTLLDRYLGAPINSDTTDLIKDAYDELKKAATSSTRHAFTKASDIALNGPYDPAKCPHIVTGMHKKTGRPCVVKFVSPPGAAGATGRLVKDSAMELEVVAITPDCTDLVQCTRIDTGAQVTSDLQGKELSAMKKVGIVMDYFPLTAVRYVPVDDDVLARGVQSISNALSYLHENNFVHMDVHPGNIFISQDGAWKLGDFDAARRVGDDITVTTPRFHLTTTQLDVATPEHDWGMLLCTLATLLARQELDGPDADSRIPQVDAPRADLLAALGTSRVTGCGEMPKDSRGAYLAAKKTGALAMLIARVQALAGDK